MSEDLKNTALLKFLKTIKMCQQNKNYIYYNFIINFSLHDIRFLLILDSALVMRCDN